LLGCERKDYHEGEKNVWTVEMPEFVNHQALKPKTTETESEMDDSYHNKFRPAQTQADTQKDN
jgi:hypothetical protein